MIQQTEYLFVYGTLMPDHGNYRSIESYVVSSTKARTSGSLVDLGPFPAMLHREGIVQGVLLEIDKHALEITDHIEGYSSSRENCLYLEDGEQVEAWTYFFAKPDPIAGRPTCKLAEKNGIPIYAWSPQR